MSEQEWLATERPPVRDEATELRARKHVLQASIAELQELVDALEELRIK